MNRKKIFSYLTLLISLLIIIFLYPLFKEPQVLQVLIQQLGWKGIFLDLLVICMMMFFPFIPFALVAGINIVIFGWGLGYTLSLVGSVLGSAICFWVARTLGQEWAKPHIAKLGKWGKLSDAKNSYLVGVARLIPILPSAAVNYAAGVSPIKFWPFVFATLLGKAPIILWESWFGHDFWQFTQYPARFAGALLSGLAIIGCAWLLWNYIDRQEKLNHKGS